MVRLFHLADFAIGSLVATNKFDLQQVCSCYFSVNSNLVYIIL